MSYTIKELLDSNQFPKMNLISDNSGIDREIKAIRIIEVSDMERYLTGGELLLTSLKAYEDTSEQEFGSVYKTTGQRFYCKKNSANRTTKKTICSFNAIFKKIPSASHGNTARLLLLGNY